MKAVVSILALAICGCVHSPIEAIVVTDDERPKVVVTPRQPVEAPKPAKIEPFPDPAFVAPVIVDPAEPVVELYAITASWCIHCPAVHDAAGGLTGITLIDIDELPDEALRINGEIPPSLPCFVRTVDGVRVDRWLGRTNRAGLIAMRDGETQ